MLVLEDSDEDRLYLARAVPRDWLGSGQEISISQAPTRWGRVSFRLVAKPATKTVVATIELSRPGAPREVHVKFRLPTRDVLHTVTVNGQRASVAGIHKDTAVILTGKEKAFEVVGHYS